MSNKPYRYSPEEKQAIIERMMPQKIEAFVKKYQLIKQHATVIVGVSGGPDSMALLHFLTERRKDNHLKLIAVGVDHQLRDKVSKADMTYVKEMCEKWY